MSGSLVARYPYTHLARVASSSLPSTKSCAVRTRMMRARCNMVTMDATQDIVGMTHPCTSTRQLRVPTCQQGCSKCFRYSRSYGCAIRSRGASTGMITSERQPNTDHSLPPEAHLPWSTEHCCRPFRHPCLLCTDSTTRSSWTTHASRRTFQTP